MTVWTPQRLPIVLPPHPGEALDSWIEAYARRLRVTVVAFLGFIGLPGASPSQMVQRLNTSQRERLHQVTGVGPLTLTGMTLEPFDGITVTFHPFKHGMGRPPTWRYHGSHSRFCPGCLTDSRGRWQLAWRQPWSFACPVHRCLLLERCPGCGQPVRAHGTRIGGPSRPALCTRGRHHADGPRRRRVECGYPLGQAPAPALPARSLVLAAQDHVTSLLDSVSPDPEPVRIRLLDLYALGWRALAGLAATPDSAPAEAHRVLAETGGQPPAQTRSQDATDIHSIAVATAIARLAVPDPEPMRPEVLEWIMRADHRLFPDISPSGRAFSWRRTSPRLAGIALSRYDSGLTLLPRLRYGTASPRPYWRKLTEEEIHKRAAAVPAKLWPSWTMRLLSPRLANGRAADRFRKVASALIMLPGSQLDYGPAASLLGQRLSHRERIAAIRVLDGYPHTSLVSALSQLAWALDQHGAPIDYARRRQIFCPDTVRLDESALRNVCRDLGWHRSAPVRTNRIRWILLALLLGADPEPQAGSLSTHQQFRQHLPVRLKEFLHDQAEANLRHFNIDEPVRWEPPAQWVSVPRWPGHDDAEINLSRAAGLAAQSPAEQQLAKDLGLTTTYLRLYFESRGITIPPPAPEPPSPRARRAPSRPRGKTVPRTGPLAADRLRELYQEQRRTLDEIAALAGCSPSTVSLAIREAGIPKRMRRPARFLEQAISREWLETEYRHRGRSSPDIARELGVRKDAVMKLVKKWDIPKHTPDQHSNPFARLGIAMSPAMQAVSRTRNCLQRLRHLTAVAEHPTLQAAALAIGVRWSALNYQLKQIEATTGFSIINIGRSRPLTVTPAGRSFLDEAARLLALLDGHAA